MSVEEKAGLIIAVRNYRCQKKKQRSDGVDFSVLEASSDDKILLRSIEPQTAAGYVSVEDVRKMVKEMKSQKCERGVLISKRFTIAASEEMVLRKIQQVSDDYMPPIKPETLFLTINNCINNLCISQCGFVPVKKSDCSTGKDSSPCRIRAISNNASFHYEHKWMNLLRDDLRQLLSSPKQSKNVSESPKYNYGSN
jgi:hypothetical protein